MTLTSTAPNFNAALEQLLTSRSAGQDVSGVVKDIIANVKTGGDAALLDYTKQFDRFETDMAGLRVTRAQIDEARAACDNELINALEVARGRIESYSIAQMPEDFRYIDNDGVELGWKYSPIQAVGLYVPGGLASYPSSVLMNAVPAKVAGVERLVVVVPAPDGALNPVVLAACDVAGVDEIWRIGGAQAVAALAYGTESIAPVDKIVGPGNAYVAEAKRQVFGQVGIDMIAGPSEILVVADETANPKWVATDLLSQAEHDELAQSILIMNNSKLVDKVKVEVEVQLKALPREKIARASWEKYGGIILTDTFDQVERIIDTIAPEHVELMCKNADELAEKIRYAGAIFIGHYSSEAIGDYVAGPSHVLPTSQTARFSSGGSVMDFMTRSSLMSCTKAAFNKIAPMAAKLAQAEGLQAHLRSVEVRLDD